MQYRKPLSILCLILFFSIQLFAQKPLPEDMDITGLWKGTMYNDTTQLNYRYEIAISQNEKGKLTGFSHTYFILDNKEYHGVKKIRIKRDGDEITTTDIELIANNYPIKPPKGVHVSNTLKFEIKEGAMLLSGAFSTNRTKEYAPATGFIQVERKINFHESALIPHLEELGLAKELSFVQEEAVAKAEIKTPPIVEQPIVKPQPVKEQPVTEQTVAKTQPVAKEKPVTEQPVVKTALVVKQQPAVQQPITKTPTTTKEQPIVKATPVVKQQPAAEKVIKQPEPVAVKKAEDKIPVSLATSSAVDIEKRSVETIQTLYFKTDSLVLTLYDNGEVDGDTVSVLMNGKLIMPRVGLSTNAVRKTIYIEDIDDSIQIVMYAETLGSLPPNTGLLIVYDGTERHEIRFSGDMKRSSAIMFRRKHD
ncbi:hypothetical protein [Ferruginibacter sp.]|nr:hypothetical protein [Ferruginibacter sp.]